MNNTLIVYASEHGTVEKCVRKLFRLMNGKVDICDLNKRDVVPDLSTYDSIIIGGSIHSGKIQKVISDFSKNNLEILLGKNIGLFISCIYSGGKAQEQLDNAFPPELSENAVVRDYFGGEINELNLNYREKFIARQMIDQENLVVQLSKDKIDRFAMEMTNVV